MRAATAILLLCCVAVLGLLGWLAAVGAASDPVRPNPAGAFDAPVRVVDAFPLMHATTPEEVRRVVKFCRAAGPESLASLREAALHSSDPLVAGNALRALGRLGAVADDHDLAALIEDPRLRVRQEAIQALGLSRSEAAVERLVPLLEQGEPALRPLVLQALANLGGERSRAILRTVLEDDRWSATERLIARRGLEQG